MHGRQINNGRVTGNSERKAERFDLPLRTFSSANVEKLVLAVGLCLLCFYLGYDFLQTIGLRFVPLDITEMPDDMLEYYDPRIFRKNDGIDATWNCLCNGSVFAISSWVAFFAAIELFAYPRIRFDKGGMHIHSMKSSTVMKFSFILIALMNFCFIFLMVLYFRALHSRHAEFQGLPWSLVALYIVADFIVVFMLTMNIRFSISEYLFFYKYISRKNENIQSKFDTQQFDNLPALIAWSDIEGIEYRVIFQGETKSRLPLLL